MPQNLIVLEYIFNSQTLKPRSRNKHRHCRHCVYTISRGH